MLPLILMACGSGLNISVYTGNHNKQRLERKVKDPKSGRTGIQYVNCSDPKFSQFKALHDGEMWKVNELYQRAKKAGVKMDDLLVAGMMTTELQQFVMMQQELDNQMPEPPADNFAVDDHGDVDWVEAYSLP